MKILYATISKTGKRPQNEDAVLVSDVPEQERWTGIICDGMGGHKGGEIASNTVISAFMNYWMNQEKQEDSKEKILYACATAFKELNAKANELHHLEMGTTLVMASIKQKRFTVVHVGDSRCYLFRKNSGLLFQTRDHTENSFGWEVVNRCFFSYDPIKAYPDIMQFPVKSGDRILLCSDGVYKSMTPEALQALMQENDTPDRIVEAIDRICQTESHDNYSAIIAFCEE